MPALQLGLRPISHTTILKTAPDTHEKFVKVDGNSEYSTVSNRFCVQTRSRPAKISNSLINISRINIAHLWGNLFSLVVLREKKEFLSGGLSESMNTAVIRLHVRK